MLETITIGELAGALAVIVAVVGGISYITKPIKDYNEKNKALEKEIEAIKEHQDNDNKRLTTLEADSKMTLRVLNEILGHLQTGNNSGGMSKVKNDLEKYIIERK